ncbi:MAG: hypothetical protein FWF20_02160 [Betaproteobacteria bacterium]|nr:hypothetical protein [Betaproteobacteria bacterium]MCL2885587.1 hypothetical protein [Betaproteobacteria bacterium]
MTEMTNPMTVLEELRLEAFKTICSDMATALPAMATARAKGLSTLPETATVAPWVHGYSTAAAGGNLQAGIVGIAANIALRAASAQAPDGTYGHQLADALGIDLLGYCLELYPTEMRTEAAG